MLNYSIDGLNWFQAGCVAMSRKVLDSFSYASQVVDGDDLLVLARTSLGGSNQHDTNLITFHRVANFRALALDLRRDYRRSSARRRCWRRRSAPRKASGDASRSQSIASCCRSR